MSKSNLHALSQPEMTSNDPLHELIRQGARDLTDRKFNRMRPSMARVFGFETRRPRQTKAD